jgi:2'-5' RNA ligase
MTTKYMKCKVLDGPELLKDLHVTFLYTKTDKEFDTELLKNIVKSNMDGIPEDKFEFVFDEIDYFGKVKDLVVLKYKAPEIFKQFRLNVLTDICMYNPDISEQNFLDYNPHITIGKRGEVDESSIVIPKELIITGIQGSRDEFLIEFGL